MANAIDASGTERPTPTCLRIASDTEIAIDLPLVTDTAVQAGGSSTASPHKPRKPLDMNVDDDSRTEWATLSLDWLYDNAPNHDQLTGKQIKALAEEFNRWARVKGPPVGPYMFKWLKRVGIVSTEPIRDQENHHPGQRKRQRLYTLPAIEVESVAPMRLAA